MSIKIILAIPCLNEEAILGRTVETTLEFIQSRMPRDQEWLVTVVDNGSSDRTGTIGRGLAAIYPGRVSYRRLGQRGKGLAIRDAWVSAPADTAIFAFMDADLATDLGALPALVEACRRTDGLAIGSRHLPESRVVRSLLRRLFSWGYRLVLKCLLGTRINALPCGFKAASAAVVNKILPQVQDNAWFFDTELVIRTERAGLPVTEIPVVWHEVSGSGRRSRVPLFRVAYDYIRQSLKLRQSLH